MDVTTLSPTNRSDAARVPAESRCQPILSAYELLRYTKSYIDLAVTILTRRE